MDQPAVAEAAAAPRLMDFLWCYTRSNHEYIAVQNQSTRKQWAAYCMSIHTEGRFWRHVQSQSTVCKSRWCKPIKLRSGLRTSNAIMVDLRNDRDSLSSVNYTYKMLGKNAEPKRMEIHWRAWWGSLQDWSLKLRPLKPKLQVSYAQQRRSFLSAVYLLKHAPSLLETFLTGS